MKSLRIGLIAVLILAIGGILTMESCKKTNLEPNVSLNYKDYFGYLKLSNTEKQKYQNFISSNIPNLTSTIDSRLDSYSDWEGNSIEMANSQNLGYLIKSNTLDLEDYTLQQIICSDYTNAEFNNTKILTIKRYSENSIDIMYLDPLTNISDIVEIRNGNNVNIYSSDKNESYKEKKSRGQAVIDCISDVYTNQGWGSVAAWVVTAYFPEYAVAVAIWCASHPKW